MIKSYNITYCSNIFKNNNIKNILTKLNLCNENLNNIKKTNKCISICLSNYLINKIKNHNTIKKILTWIKKKKLSIILTNGFVYKKFHKKLIKEDIYFPDWTTYARLNFTKSIIFFAQKISKQKKKHGISTVPISYKLWIKKEKKYNIHKSLNNLYYLLNLMIKIKKYKNILIHLDIEPEPCCELETATDFINFFNNSLLPNFKIKLKNKLKISKKKAESYIKCHIRLCYDICHFSVNFENQKHSLNLINKFKIKVGRIQVSSAIKIIDINEKIKKYLRFILNSSFLHQTIIKTNNYKKLTYTDFKNFKFNNNNQNYLKEMRIHCHIPLYIEKLTDNILTTFQETKDALNFIKKLNISTNFEIETYTYNTIYKSNKNKFQSIKKEYIWLNKIIKKI